MKINQFTRLTHLTVASSFAITGFALAVPQELVEGLGNESYQEREKAEQELSLWAKERGETAFDELSEMKKKTSSPEVKSRLDNVLSGVHVYKAVPGTQGFMGISMEPILGGSVITSVSPDTPAERAGLRPNDKIIELDGIDLAEKNNHAEEATDFLRMYVRNKKSGEKLSIKIDREGKILTKDLKLADYNTEITKLDPFGDMGGVQILPMQGGVQGGAARVIPRAHLRIQPRQLGNNQQELLQLNLLLEKQLLQQAELPEEFKEMLKQQEQRNQQRLEALKLQLKQRIEEEKELKK